MIPSFLKFQTCEKSSLGPGDTTSRTGAAGVFFRSRFRLDQEKTWRFESCSSCLNISTFLKSQTCRSNLSREESMCDGDLTGRKTVKFFSIVSLFSLIFPRAVNIAPGVGFQRSWCIQKACDTIFLKVSDLRRTKLGFGRYGPANRGYRRVFPHQRVIFRSRFRLDRGSS